MARAKSTKPTGDERKPKPEDNSHFAAWQAFYAVESKKLLAKQPKLKQRTMQKRLSAAFKRHKAELASQEGGGETGSGEEK
ncbi:uncharacterized protein RHOBADRAFT_47019 [Rhodotorula graminis WP1]|uniref:Uncharacterized protein n=1 Tax=Rhodotorula graminis (strain WP1) TaxID=578459 RepID=A0A0P9IS01_RHOGW|nr:uncharacterized protein RHOBADRAFT_47019 [Rhodotorula graminis WP1]KPV72177.1 hypothetical protein RHOBADRAFT_47019 [Rhodotorula graminis WP1]